jgi:hypothetical protein
MGRSHVPTAILDAKGSFLKHPDRKRPNEPKSDRPLGAPPKHLNAELKQIWKEIAKRLLPGVATVADRDAFEMMVRLTAQMRNETVENPFPGVLRGNLITLWSRFAMTPADRCKVSVDKPKESALSAFMKRKKESTAPPAEEQSLIN